MSEQRISAGAAAALATAAYGALLVCALGIITLWTDAPLIDLPQIGAVPVMLAGVFALAAFICMLLRALRPPRPAYTTAIAVALVAALVHLAALWVAVALFGGDAASATAAVAQSVTGWSSATVLVLAAACAWAGVALRRTEADRPRWPWEEDDDR